MNKQILYIAMYRALECLEEESPNDALASYLDKANPYVFKDRKSADPVLYNQFMEWLNNEEVNDDNSFEVVKKYVNEKTEFPSILSEIDEEEWSALIALIKREELQLVQ